MDNLNNLDNLKSGEFLVDGVVKKFDDLKFVELKVSTSHKLKDIESLLTVYGYSVDYKSCETIYSIVVWLNSCEYVAWYVSAGSIENEVDLGTLIDILDYQAYGDKNG